MATAAAENQAQAIERGYRSLSSLFRPQTNSKTCPRCMKDVYLTERMPAPVHDVYFHKSCFKCIICGVYLNLKNYCSNQTDANDHEVYCHVHMPRIGAPKFGHGALGIEHNINAQKDYRKMSKKLKPEVREAGTVRIPSYGMQALEMKRAVSVPKTSDYPVHDHTGAQIDGSALQIKGPVEAQLLVKSPQKNFDRHHYPPNIYKKRQRLVDAQKRLEEEHRKEEDRLLQEITQERRQQVRRLSDELNKEWQFQLKELTEKFEREMGKKAKKLKDNEKKQMTIHFENQKKDLEIIINEKREKKRESMTLRMREKEQKKTAMMVTKQSKQMLELLATKQEELKQELQQELEQESTKPSNGHVPEPEQIEEALEALEITTTELPPPHPPSCRKKDIYTDVSVFNELDEQVIKVAENDQVTYTDLIQQLTENLTTDLEKVRAIYRWVTVKDLNVMNFQETLGKDTPMGLLRGIKFGTETYHVLFMRLCSYAGLHCVEIKGHSKSVGYEPGMKILPETFQNTWNAVLIEGDWRLIQCNWGARHLVLNKDKKKDKAKPKSKDQIRYQYDEHYFLTDPDEFIQEFWSKEPEWQLLENAISLEEFEALPFVRSVFFHFGMMFDQGMTAVLEASEKGGYDIKLKVPESLENDLVFYYQMRFAEKDKRMDTMYKGANLERFVFQTMLDNTVMFSIHLPTTGEFFFEIFANKIDQNNRFGNDEDSNSAISPFRLKCACKFKIVCKSLSGKMHPLPDCASGEWGPKKGRRHFGIRLRQIKHIEKSSDGPFRRSPDPSDSSSDKMSDSGSTGSSSLGETPDNPKAGIINVEDSVDMYFKIPRPLHFVAKLKMNHYDSKTLDPFVNTNVEDDILKITISPPMNGQYGLDVYARPQEAGDSATLSHAFKYLLNVLRVTNPLELPRSIPKPKKERWGATSQFEELGLKALSHKEAKINCSDSNQCTIEIFVPNKVHVTYQFLKEPDDEKNELVTMLKDDHDSQKKKFFINMPLTGNYMLSLFARNKDSDDRSIPNVFNYLICYRKSSKETNGNASIKEERKHSSGIFRKSLFKKSEKDK